MIAILDYGMGNLRSVAKALEHVGAEPVLTSDHARVGEAGAVVLPGVGAMPKAMERVRSLALDRLLRERVEAGVPVIGLCMGMQLLFEATSELGGAEGIGLLRGRVERLEAPKVPQIGWNEVHWRRPSALTAGLPDPCAFYHANSYAPRPADEDVVLGTADYGGEFVSVVEQPPVYGLQSHPEKSGPDGLRLLRNFVALQHVILLPAIDIRDGKAVRLRQGHFDQETVYADDPLEAARSFVEAGARFLHVVDLDGARAGEPANLEHVERITSELAVPVELGGGLRSIASIRRALSRRRGARGAGHGRLHRPGPARRGAVGLHLAHPGGCGRARRPRVGGGLDARDPDAAARTPSGTCSGAAPRASSTPTWTATACSRASTSTRCGGCPRPCAGAS